MAHNKKTAEENEEVVKIFQSFDTNGDGFISKDEVKQAFVQLLNTEKRKEKFKLNDEKLEEKANRFIEKYDLNCDGRINYVEFWQYIQSMEEN